MMTALSAGLLVSKCHEAIVYLDDDGTNRCSTCLAICETAGTLGELYERKKAERGQEEEGRTQSIERKVNQCQP